MNTRNNGGASSLPMSSSGSEHGGGERPSYQRSSSSSLFLLRTVIRPRFLYASLAMAGLWFLVLLQSHFHLAKETPNIEKDKSHKAHKVVLPFMKNKNKESLEKVVLHTPQEQFGNSNAAAVGGQNWQSSSALELPAAFDAVLERARQKEEHCTVGLQKLNDPDNNIVSTDMDKSFEVPFQNGTTVASLPSFGIIDRLQAWKDDPPHEEGATGGGGSDELASRFKDWNKCELPPETECQESKFTVIFMAYNPDRLHKTFGQIQNFCTAPEWTSMVQEVILVWNGPRLVNETQEGQTLLKFADESKASTSMATLRVEYPLVLGLENDLMNRYHPGVVQVQTKAILYYDDDGPFYSPAAVQGGFELWKRHARAQVGAMARQISYSERQKKEHATLIAQAQAASKPVDQEFVSHCTNVGEKEQVDYNFRYFANYDANMVLPSGSLLHSNYLCFLWHPVLEPIRHFVRQHPVHPDDVTVSMVVSQLGGRAPRVYSRRLKPVDASVADIARRRLLQQEEDYYYYDDEVVDEEERLDEPPEPQQQQQQQLHASIEHRRLLFNINWDAGAGWNDKKQFWADLRTEAINALVRYFGSINSGSIGWCEGTKYYNEKTDGRCHPVMGRIGWLPWMNPDGTPKDTCP